MMIIDSFAGGGGASTGIEHALGRSPDVAINHNAAALALHAANHPDTLHLDSNIWDVDPRTVTGGRPVGLLWASPDCKHFSKAKGGAPRDRNIRDLAWVVVRWAEDVKPDVILMENVEEFLTWGPVCEEGRPIREFAGMTFETWVKRLRRAGYKVQWRELRACDYGAPTIRKRFFMVARRDGRPIVWPRPTHGAPDSPAVRRDRLKPWRTAAECIDWSLPCPSIFDSTAQIMEKHGLRAKRPLAHNTLARVARGMKRYVLDAEEPFLVSIAHGDSGGRREYPLTDPHGVVTAGGIAHALIAPSITRFNGGATGQDMRDPLATVTANSFIKRPGGAAPLGLIAPLLVQVGYGERPGQHPRALDPSRPMGTIVAGGVKHASVIAALMGCGGRAAQSRPRGADEPTATVTAKADTCIATAFLAQHNKMRKGVNPGRPATAPLSTITGKGSQQNIVASWFAKYYGAGTGARTDDPMHTITVNDRFGHVQAAAKAPPLTPEHEDRARAVADFLRAHGEWTGGEFVTLDIDGETFVIVDIGLRMLTPRELFNAQGFPPDYVIEGVWQQAGDDWTWRPFPKDVQVSCCGNSVCPDIAAALVSANCAHLKREREAA